jgi:small-conductance mechanosensitive channel
MGAEGMGDAEIRSVKSMKLGLHKTALLLGSLFAAVLVLAQGNSSTAPTLAQDPDQIIKFLSKVVTWHRQLAAEPQIALASDLTTVAENRRVADQAVQLAFEYARGQAPMQPKRSSTTSQAQGDSGSQYDGLGQAAQRADKDVQDTEAELQSVREKLANAPAQKKTILQSQTAELEGELGLLRARRDAVQGMVQFVSSSSSGGGGGSLRAQIDTLARTLPAALTRTPSPNQDTTGLEPPSSVNTALTTRPQPTGIWGLAADLITLSGKVHTLNDDISSTAELQQMAKQLQAPQLDHLRILVDQGDQLFAAADTATPALLARQRQQLDQLTAQFKQTSAAMLPLSKVDVLLEVYSKNLDNWRETVKDQARDELRQLMFRLAVLIILIAAVFGMGEIWRRATFRYVHDARRRHQFLLLRRIAMWVAIALVIVLTFATQLGSAVTFAGLLTAGVAVALQNVIVSVVAYFFLIGKYGIRVGDRVQIAGVTGEVVDIGLVRIHLMELGGPGESQPSGRVVAFANSIVFQPTAGVFKQIPGTSFVWHEVKLVLAPETDYHAAKDRLTEAAGAALAQDRESLETQRQLVERNLSSVSAHELAPRVRLHYSGSGIEATVRFPVELEKATETDDQVMRELLAALEREPKLKLVSAEMPVSQAAG